MRALLAINYLGAVCVPLALSYRGASLQHVIADSGASCMFGDDVLQTGAAIAEGEWHADRPQIVDRQQGPHGLGPVRQPEQNQIALADAALLQASGAAPDLLAQGRAGPRLAGVEGDEGLVAAVARAPVDEIAHHAILRRWSAPFGRRLRHPPCPLPMGGRFGPIRVETTGQYWAPCPSATACSSRRQA